MATPNTMPVYTSTPRTEVMAFWGGGYQIGDPQFIFTAGSCGSVLDRLVAANSADIAVDFVLSLCGSTTGEYFPIATGSIPVGSGYSTEYLSLMPTSLADVDGKIVISGVYPMNGQGTATVYIAINTEIPADKTVSILVMASDY